MFKSKGVYLLILLTSLIIILSVILSNESNPITLMFSFAALIISIVGLIRN